MHNEMYHNLCLHQIGRTYSIPGKIEECVKTLVGKPERNRSQWNIRLRCEHIIKACK
jgi:hypothetical protein